MIEVKDLTFCYRESSEPVIHHINLTIPDGQFVGITGAACSGKSSLTFALRSSALYGDSLVIPAAGYAYNGTPYDEYLMVDLYTPELSLIHI